jgi:large subunit ribosomal protein L32
MSIRMRSTKSATKNRRSHHALVGIKAVSGEREGTLRLPHHVDEATGMYRGKQIFTPKSKKVKGNLKAGPRTEAAHDEHKHEKGEHKHENADKTRSRGFFGRVANALPKARSGAGGGGA